MRIGLLDYRRRAADDPWAERPILRGGEGPRPRLAFWARRARGRLLAPRARALRRGASLKRRSTRALAGTGRLLVADRRASRSTSPTARIVYAPQRSSCRSARPRTRSSRSRCAALDRARALVPHPRRDVSARAARASSASGGGGSSSRATATRRSPRATSRAWPARVRAAGIVRVTGGILGDETLLRPTSASGPGGSPPSTRTSPRRSRRSSSTVRTSGARWSTPGAGGGDPLRRRRCKAAGVKVPGGRRMGRAHQADDNPGRHDQARAASRAIVRQMNRESDNFFAEMLLKHLGARIRGRGHDGGRREGRARRARRSGVPLDGRAASPTAPGLSQPRPADGEGARETS